MKAMYKLAILMAKLAMRMRAVSRDIRRDPIHYNLYGLSTVTIKGSLHGASRFVKRF